MTFRFRIRLCLEQVNAKCEEHAKRELELERKIAGMNAEKNKQLLSFSKNILIDWAIQNFVAEYNKIFQCDTGALVNYRV